MKNWIICDRSESKQRWRWWRKAENIRLLAYFERSPNWGQFAAPCLSRQWTRRIDFVRSISYGAYSGLAIVTYMSSEYEIKAGRVVRSRKPLATRGLNRNCNRRLKELFISAAVAGSRSEPYRSYVEGLQQRGIRTEMARLTLARKIAAVALRVWEERRDVRSEETEVDDIAVPERFAGRTINSTLRRRCARNG